MEREVFIEVYSLQESPGGKNRINFSTKGQLLQMEDIFTLIYQEKSPGMEGVETTMEIQEQEEMITLSRRGDITSQQVFKEDRRDVSSYHTPFGKLFIEIEVEQVELSLGEDYGSVFLKYGLRLNDDPVSNNRLIITYRCDKKVSS